MLLLAAGGCGSYVPTSTATQRAFGADLSPAERAQLYEAKSKAALDCLEELHYLLAGVTDNVTAAVALPKTRDCCQRMKALTLEIRGIEAGLPAEARRSTDKEYAARLTEAVKGITAESKRLRKNGQTIPLANAGQEGLDEMAAAAKGPLPAPPNPGLPAPESSPVGVILVALLLLMVFALCVGFLWAQGLWSNIILLVHVITAALLAMNFYEPLARWLTEKMPSYIVMWDYLALWGLFGGLLLVGRELTDRLSRVNVRFLQIVERPGSILMSAWIGWVMVGFTAVTLHTAPLARNFIFGGFQPDSAMFFGVLHPDRQWLAFTRRMSQGAYCRTEGDVFDPKSEFIARQTERRAWFQGYVRDTGALRIDEQFVNPANQPRRPP
ncbi:MAG: hypothetical protein ABSF26_03345 [Thermoguttaceae bacterium]